VNCENAGVARFLDVKAVMDCTHCSRITVYRRCKSGELPYVKLNGRLLFRKKDLEEWFRKNTHGSDSKWTGGDDDAGVA